MDIIADDLWICVDCTLFIANGDEPEDRDDLPQAIYQNWPTAYLIVGDEHDEFSRHECDACGDRLAGYRHSAIAVAAK